MKNGNISIKFLAALFILCLGISLMAVACTDTGSDETNGGTETTDTETDTQPDGNEDGGNGENKETDPVGITAESALGDADMPTVGWDETAD